MILAGDVGGTKTNLGLFEASGGRGCGASARAKFHSPDFPGLSAMVHAFLDDTAAPYGHRGRLLRHPRAGDREPGEHPQPRLGDGRRAGGRGLHVRHVALINDLVATAEGIPLLAADEVAVLQEGVPEPQGTGR